MNDKIETKHGLSLLIAYTEAELQRAQEVIKKTQIVEATLIQSLQVLKAIDVSALEDLEGSGLKELTNKLEMLREPGYPYSGTNLEKAFFVLRKFNRVVRPIEISTEIIRIEGTIQGKIIEKSLWYRMNQEVANGNLIIAKAKNQTRHIFYCLPEFFETIEKGNMRLKYEHLPNEKSWGTIPADQRSFQKVTWTSFIK